MAGKERSAFLIVDVGESTTKAALVKRENGAFRLKGVSEAETTTDAPILDVTSGIEKAVSALGKKTGEKLLGSEGPIGATLLCSSGDGGGLYMMVAGVIGMISGESAQRAALGAGAHLIGVFSKDNPKPEHIVVDEMRSARPDMFLLAGGTDGGAFSQVLEMAKTIEEADVRPRFGEGYRLPVIYAGNVDARQRVEETLTEKNYATRTVDNVRPVIDRENLGPAREAIYDSYMEHVIVHSPGYDRLAKWVGRPIIPTQAAIGKILYAYAQMHSVNLLAVNIGGSTTDVYSVYNGVFNRSLNAEVGLTYGIMNVLKTVGVEGLADWMPGEVDERRIRNIIGNLMIRQRNGFDADERLIRGAVAREAIRIGVEEHKRLASRLKGVTTARTIADMFAQSLEATYLDMKNTRSVIGMGGVFNETLEEAALILMDSLEPTYFTEMYVDRTGLTPHTGMLLEDAPEAALTLFSGEVLQRIGTCVAPSGKTSRHEAVAIKLTRQNGQTVEDSVGFGEIRTIKLLNGEICKVEATPGRGLDLGRGKGKPVEAKVIGGQLGLIVDARGRPFEKKRESIHKWSEALRPGGARG